MKLWQESVELQGNCLTARCLGSHTQVDRVKFCSSLSYMENFQCFYLGLTSQAALLLLCQKLPVCSQVSLSLQYCWASIKGLLLPIKHTQWTPASISRCLNQWQQRLRTDLSWFTRMCTLRSLSYAQRNISIFSAMKSKIFVFEFLEFCLNSPKHRVF